MLMRLSHVCLGVADVDASVAFYGGVLGAQVAHEFRNDAGERYGVMLACGGGTFIELFRRRAATAKGGAAPDEGFRHLCFEVADIEAAAERLRRSGHECLIRRGRTDRILQFFIHDPDGAMVEFHQHDAESVLTPWLSGDRSAARENREEKEN